MHVPILRQTFLETTIPIDCKEFFDNLNSKFPAGSIKVAVFSESWCGDCVENVPVVARLAEDYPCFNLKIFPADLNMELMKKYLCGHKPAIPFIIFFSPGGDIIARFVEMPENARRYLERKYEEIRDLSGAQKTKAVYEIRRELRALYKEYLQDDTIKEIKAQLERWYGSKGP